MSTYGESLVRAWPILMEAVRMGRTVTYTELAGRAGPPLHRRHIHRQLLTPLSLRCRRAGLPDLPALVVRQDTGLPGVGWFDAVEAAPAPASDSLERWALAVRACWTHPWPHDAPDARLLEP